MKRGYPPCWLSALVLAGLLLWRVMGAPLTFAQFGALETPLWQAQALLPSRVARVMRLWLPAPPEEATTLPDDATDADGRELARLREDAPASLTVWLAEEQRLAQMTLNGYVCGVVAAEMPASYHAEALKAQAVAARTRALYQADQGGCASHAGADICTDSGHCQGYATLAECREMWGAEYEAYRDRIVAAVSATGDELLTYEQEPILVMYHAISGGRTEDAQTVFSESVPYLVSVESAGEEGARGFNVDMTFTYEQLASALNTLDASIGADAGSVRSTFAIGTYTPSGRVDTVLACGRELPATSLRRALGLRSTWFSLTASGDEVVFHQQGYGHGVGMSQAGANAMAAQGDDYRQILGHYYPGTTLETR